MIKQYKRYISAESHIQRGLLNALQIYEDTQKHLNAWSCSNIFCIRGQWLGRAVVFAVGQMGVTLCSWKLWMNERWWKIPHFVLTKTEWRVWVAGVTIYVYLQFSIPKILLDAWFKQFAGRFEGIVCIVSWFWVIIKLLYDFHLLSVLTKGFWWTMQH